MQLTPITAKELLGSRFWTDLQIAADAIAFDEWKNEGGKSGQAAIRYSIDRDGYLKKALTAMANQAPIGVRNAD